MTVGYIGPDDTLVAPVDGVQVYNHVGSVVLAPAEKHDLGAGAAAGHDVAGAGNAPAGRGRAGRALARGAPRRPAAGAAGRRSGGRGGVIPGGDAEASVVVC